MRTGLLKYKVLDCKGSVLDEYPRLNGPMMKALKKELKRKAEKVIRWIIVRYDKAFALAELSEETDVAHEQAADLVDLKYSDLEPHIGTEVLGNAILEYISRAQSLDWRHLVITEMVIQNSYRDVLKAPPDKQLDAHKLLDRNRESYNILKTIRDSLFLQDPDILDLGLDLIQDRVQKSLVDEMMEMERE